MKKPIVFLSVLGLGLLALPFLFKAPTETAVPSFKNEVFPIIKAKCNDAEGCHDVQRENPIFTTYDLVKPQAKRILRRIKDRSIPMPPRDSGLRLSNSEIATIEAWVKAGAPEN
jgi:hypothetical protein